MTTIPGDIGPRGDCFTAAGQRILEMRGQSRPLTQLKQVHIPQTLQDQLFEPPPSWSLVHGVVTGSPDTPVSGLRFVHAWLECVDRLGSTWVLDCANDRELFVPADLYYRFGTIRDDECIRYPQDDAVYLLQKTGYFGPWVSFLYVDA